MSDDASFTPVNRGVSLTRAQKYQTRAASVGALLSDNGEKPVENAEVPVNKTPKSKPKAKKSIGAKQTPGKKIIKKKKNKDQDQALEEAFKEREAQLHREAEGANQLEEQQADTTENQQREEEPPVDEHHEADEAGQAKDQQRDVEKEALEARYEEEIRKWREENSFLLDRLSKATKSRKRKHSRSEDSPQLKKIRKYAALLR